MRRILFVPFFAIASCSDNAPKIPNDVKFEILTEKIRALNICNLVVNLNKKVDTNTLKAIATELRNKRKHFDKLWISYYINNQGIESGAWASTSFTPDLEIEVFGSTPDQDIKTGSAGNINGQIIGKWRSDKSLSGAVLLLFKDGQGRLNMKVVLKNGEEMVDQIQEKTENGNVIYTDGNSHGEYYILESNGNLGMYGRSGKYDEAEKI